MPFTSETALSSLNRWKGQHRAAFWRKLGFPNLVRARAALANKVRLRRLEEWKARRAQAYPVCDPGRAARWAQDNEGEEVDAGLQLSQST